MAVLRIWGPAIAAMAAIFFASSLPNPPAPEDVSDKTLHFIAYAVLGLACLRGTSAARWRGVSARTGLLAWLLTVAYGASDEIHQVFVVNRSPSTADWVADATGAGVAIAAIVAMAGMRGANRKV